MILLSSRVNRPIARGWASSRLTARFMIYKQGAAQAGVLGPGRCAGRVRDTARFSRRLRCWNSSDSGGRKTRSFLS